MAVSELETAYRENGYAIVRGLLERSRVERLLSETDRLHALGCRYRTTTVDGLVRWLVIEGEAAAPVLRALQNSYRISPSLDEARTNLDILEILDPLIGPDIDAVVNSLFWKTPGEPNTTIAYHQDAMFRKPKERFRNLASSYVQFGIALDPHGPANGGMKIVPGSHLAGDLEIERDASVLVGAADASDLEAFGFRRDQIVNIDLEPGDAIYWHPYLLHGSPANRSMTLNRRFFVTGYMRKGDSDTGDPAFRDGQPVPWKQQDV